MDEEPLFVGYMSPNNQEEAGVYLYKQIGTGKVYIGSTVNLRGRHCQHTSYLRNGKHVNRKFQKAFNESPFFELHFCKLQDTEGKSRNRLIEEVREMEQKFIDGSDRSQLLNLSTDTFATGANREVSLETREKLRKAMLGRPVSEETRRRHSEAWKTRKVSPETCEKIRNVHTRPEMVAISRKNLKKANELNKRSVTIENRTYESLKEASDVLGVPLSTLRKRLNSLNPRFALWNYA